MLATTLYNMQQINNCSREPRSAMQNINPVQLLTHFTIQSSHYDIKEEKEEDSVLPSDQCQNSDIKREQVPALKRH